MKVDILLIASFGGHFEQLIDVRQAWAGRSVVFVATRPDAQSALNGESVAVVWDCHRGQWLRALVCSVQLLCLFIRYRPRALISTGALPGLIAVFIARAFNCRVIWMDSVANAERLSASGRVARTVAHHCLTQWPEVARHENARYLGSLF